MLGARAASRQKRNSFTSNWDTTQAGSANDSVDLENYPLRPDGSYNFKVYWGDGTTDIITSYNQAETLHQYASTGIYEIRIGGLISGWQFSNYGDDDKIIEIYNWGPLRFVSDDVAIFYNCSNLDITSTDSLTLGASNGHSMFQGCPKLGDQGNMNSWDTSSATSMQEMFLDCTGFNQPIGNWETSR